MAERKRASQGKKEEADKQHRNKRQESEPSFDQSMARDNGRFSQTETPFHPQMNEHAATLSRIPFAAQRHEFIMRLNNTYGYRYVQRLVESVNAQAKLTVSNPGDVYEQEADRVAEDVTRSMDTPVQRQAPEDEEELQAKPFLQRQDEEEDLQMQEEEDELQAKPAEHEASSVSNDIETQINSSRSGGQNLPDNVRGKMEGAFGADFSGVQVHTDPESHVLNEQLSARAFTTGQDIFFRDGEYSPGSDGGRKLLAHELTHVVQQNNSVLNRRAGDPDYDRVPEASRKQHEESIQRVGTQIVAEPKAGTSIHPTLTMGADNDKEAVKELKQKLVTARGDIIPPNPSDVFDATTKDAVIIFQRANSIRPANGVVNKATWDELDKKGKSSVGRVEREWEEKVGGSDYALTSKYAWRIERTRVVVTVGIHYVAHATNPPDDLAASKAIFNKSITDRWNRFKAVRTDPSESLDIVFEITDKADNEVTIEKGAGQSDAGHWYTEDFTQYPNVPAHEFGHLIGLEDEYQREEPAYKKLHPEASEQDIENAKVSEGEYTNQPSLMGMGAIDEHVDVNPESRHVREFVKYVQQLKGGEWKAQ